VNTGIALLINTYQVFLKMITYMNAHPSNT